MYLSIQQHMEAPELTNPPRMPQCISSSRVSKALTAAINVKYQAMLTMNASVDTTYIQVRKHPSYSWRHTQLRISDGATGTSLMFVVWVRRVCRVWVWRVMGGWGVVVDTSFDDDAAAAATGYTPVSLEGPLEQTMLQSCS
jgi:hypothetical protein